MSTPTGRTAGGSVGDRVTGPRSTGCVRGARSLSLEAIAFSGDVVEPVDELASSVNPAERVGLGHQSTQTRQLNEPWLSADLVSVMQQIFELISDP
jgi:hypothetical protein